MLHRDPGAALRKSLEDPPIFCKDEAVKVKDSHAETRASFAMLLQVMAVRDGSGTPLNRTLRFVLQARGGLGVKFIRGSPCAFEDAVLTIVVGFLGCGEV